MNAISIQDRPISEDRRQAIIERNGNGAIHKGDPVWELALFFPCQGDWTEADYLALDTNRLVELSDGCLEFLPMPTVFHQGIAQFVFLLLNAFVHSGRHGEAFMAPLPIRLWQGKMREPDILFLRSHRIRDRRKPPEGADLAMEVVSEGDENEKRDYVTKLEEYAKAKIGEYWIIDPQQHVISVYVLEGDRYRLHGKFTNGTHATSVILSGFAVDVAAAFAAGEGPQGSPL